MSLSYSSSFIVFLTVAAGTCFSELLSSNGLFRLVTETCVSESLSSNALFRLSGVMSQYIYIYTYL
jgi:hypothetical protein